MRHYEFTTNNSIFKNLALTSINECCTNLFMVHSWYLFKFYCLGLKVVFLNIWIEKIVFNRDADIIDISRQPPPRRPLAYAEANESDEEQQFRKVFKQLAGDVSLIQTHIHK